MTFVHLLTFEQAESGPGEETVSAEDVCERLAAQVRLLDGSSRTLVIAHGPGRAHLASGETPAELSSRMQPLTTSSSISWRINLEQAHRCR